MAIQKSYMSKGGVELSEAYHKIDQASITRSVGNGGTANFSFSGNVNIYRDSTARTQGLSPVVNFSFAVTDVGDSTDFTDHFSTGILDSTNVNIVNQAYVYMKSQSSLFGIDYTDGTDV